MRIQSILFVKSPEGEPVAKPGSYVIVPPTYSWVGSHVTVYEFFESKNFQVITTDSRLNLSSNEHYELIEILLDPPPSCTPNQARLPICMHADSYCIDLVQQIFLDSDTKVFSFQKRGVIIPAIDNDFKIFEPYVTSNNIIFSHLQGGSLLHFAVKLGHESFINFLLKYACVNTEGEDKATPLHLCTTIGGCERIAKLLLLKGAKVDAKMRDGSTPLTIACRNGDTKMVQLFVKKGANLEDKDWNGMTSLLIAVNYGYVDMVAYLLQQGADVSARVHWMKGFNSLHLAVERRNLQIVKCLLQKAARAPSRRWKHSFCSQAYVDFKCRDGHTPLFLAVDRGYDEIIAYILTQLPSTNDESNKRAFKLAFERGNLEAGTIRKILNHGFDIKPEDANNPTLLYFAIYWHRFEIVQKLLKYVTDVNVPLNVAGRGKLSLLHCVLRLLPGFSGSQEIKRAYQTPYFRLLLNHGCDPNSELSIYSGTGNTPLYDALYELNIGAVELFLDYKYNVNIRDGPNPLLFVVDTDDKDLRSMSTWSIKKGAIDKYRAKIVELLLQRGADMNAVSPGTQKTLIQIALQRGQLSTFETLLKFGAEFSLSDINGEKAVQASNLKTILDHYFQVLTTEDELHMPRLFWLCAHRFALTRTKVLAEHLCKIKAIHVSQGSSIRTLIPIVFQNNELFCLDDFEEKCQAEVRKLKDFIGATEIAFYDILVKGIDGVSCYAKNEGFVRALKEHPFNEFEIYGSILSIIFRRGVMRRELVCDAIKMLCILLPSFSALPDELQETIVYLLTNQDITILKKCLNFK